MNHAACERSPYLFRLAKYLGRNHVRGRRKGSALTNLAGTLCPGVVGCTLSVGGEVKMEIPANIGGAR